MMARAALASLLLLAAAAAVVPRQEEEGGEEELARLVRSAPPAERYPDADALVLRDERRVQILANGQVRERLHRVVRIHNNRGRDRHADVRVPFRAGEEEVRVLRARTLRADGTLLEAPAAAVTEVAAGPAVANQRELVVSLLGVEPGAATEVLLSRSGTRGGARAVSGELRFQESDPILERLLSIRVPAGVELAYAYSSDLDAPLIRRSGGEAGGGATTYVWRTFGRPAVPREPWGPDYGAVGSRLIYSTFPSWEAVHRELADSFYRGLAPALTGAAKEAAMRLSEGNPAADEVASRLDRYLRARIRRLAIPLKRCAFRCRSARQVFDSGYGHDLELALLATAMLREAGVQAVPALISASSNFVRSVPAPAQFDRAAVVVGAGEDRVWFYPDWTLCESGGRPPADRTVLYLLGDRYDIERTAAMPTGRHGALTRVQMELLPDGALTGSTYAALSGVFNLHYCLDGEGTDLRGLVAEAVDTVVPGAQIESAITLRRGPDSFNLEWRWRAGEELGRSGGFSLLRFRPSLVVAHREEIPLAAERRRTPLILPAAWEEQQSIELKLPPGLRPHLLPAERRLINSAGRLEIRTVAEESRLTVERYLRIESATVRPASYPDLRRLLAAWRSPAATTIVLAPSAPGAARP